MSQKSNPAVIGAFVVGAIAVVGVGLILLGSGRYFAETEPFVLYFEGDLAGLDVGAPVEYRGVRVGSVTAIRLEYNTDTGKILIPVYIQLEPDRIKYIGSSESRGMEYHIEAGLRGQLHTQSLITGKLKISLVSVPDSPVRLVRADPKTPEIPTVPRLVDTLSKSIENLPLTEIVLNVSTTFQQISQMVASQETKDAISALNRTMIKVEGLFEELQDSVPPLLKSTRKNSDNFLNTQKELTATLVEIREMMDEKSPARYQAGKAMERIAEAADSMERLLDYLQRHPEALLTGKQTNPVE